jgi:hypothetical protein
MTPLLTKEGMGEVVKLQRSSNSDPLQLPLGKGESRTHPSGNMLA